MNKFQELVATSEASLIDVMKKIQRNARGICFIVDSRRVVIGSVTDGDIRRFLITNDNINVRITEVMNSSFVSLDETAKPETIRRSLREGFKIIPLLDSKGRLVNFADAYTNSLIPVAKPCLKGRELELLTECITSNWISSQGVFIQRFESEFASLHQGRFSLSVSNGTTALHLALVALGIGEGDEVIVPDLTFAASANAVLHCNATPVLCEVDKASLCLNVAEARQLISSKTKAIMPVHLYGSACNMKELGILADEFGLYIIEDCAEGLGTMWQDRPVGTFGDAATFSFFGNKTITTGEGGMILFKDERIFDKAKILRDHGMSPERKYWHEEVGFNYRMTNMQAALGVAQLERFDAIVESKRKIGMRYLQKLADCTKIARLPACSELILDTFWLFTVILEDSVDRSQVIERLKSLGIETRPLFYPLHQMPPYKEFKRSNDLSVSNWASSNGISLPSSVDLTEEEQEYVCEMLLDILA